MIQRLAAAALLAGVALSAPVAAQQSPPSYYVFAVDAFFGPRDKIGSKRAGLLCVPAGPLRWRDVDDAPANRLGATLGAALSDAGLRSLSRDRDVFESGGPDADYRLVVTVQRIEGSVCAPHWGLGSKRGFDGHGRITLRWQIYARATRTLVDDWTSTSAFDLHRTDDTPLLRAALNAAARDFAAHTLKSAAR